MFFTGKRMVSLIQRHDAFEQRTNENCKNLRSNYKQINDDRDP